MCSKIWNEWRKKKWFNAMDEMIAKEGKAVINSHIDMKASDDTFVIGWLASQTDMLSEDWHIIE